MKNILKINFFLEFKCYAPIIAFAFDTNQGAGRLEEVQVYSTPDWLQQGM